MIKELKYVLGVGLFLILTKQRSVGIGKLVSQNAKSGTRIDDYWGNLKPISWSNDKPKPMTVEQIINIYNLHGIEFGNWMNQQDRVNHLYGIQTSLSHLAKVFGVARKNVGLRGKLQIAAGARGKGGKAIAFYSPTKIVINITKNTGPGSFAHEYGHALDHFSMWGRGKKGFASGGKTTTKTLRVSITETEALYENIFKHLYYNEDGTKSRFNEALLTASDYYQGRAEVFARLFERYVYLDQRKRGVKNNYLSSSSVDIGTPPDKLVFKVARPLKSMVKKILTK